jgi:cell division protein FtsB
MSTRPRTRTTRTLPAAPDRLIVGAALAAPRPAAADPAIRARRTAVQPAAQPRRTVLGVRLALGTARRPRWPRVILAVVAAYALVLTGSDVVHLMALDRQIAGVDAQIAQVSAHDAVLRMEAAALQSPADIADTARRWLGLAAPGDVVFTPVAPGH